MVAHYVSGNLLYYDVIIFDKNYSCQVTFVCKILM